MEGETPVQPAVGGAKKSKLLLIIVIVLVLIGAGVAAYFVLAKKADSNGSGSVISTVVNKATLNPNCKYNDPDLCKFINGWKEVKYLTMTSSDTDKDGKAYNTVYKMAGDDHSQYISSENGKESYNTIQIDKTTYTKDYTDNKWFKYAPIATEENVLKETESTINFDDKADKTEDKTTYKKIGTEACGKLTCFKYQVIDPDNTDSTEFIYFDNKDYQLRKTRTEMKDGSVSEGTYDYAKVTISEPSPTKEGNPYSLPTGLTTPTTSTTEPSAVTTLAAPSTTDISDSSDTDSSTYESTDTSADESGE